MTEKEFFKRVSQTKDDFLDRFLRTLQENKIKYCAIGGLAVNAYAEPVVSLDLDIVIVSDGVEELLSKLTKAYKVETFPNSINVGNKGSDLRIQIQTDSRYQEFIKRAKLKHVLGYRIPVAAIEDVLQGKIWAAMDETRRPSKRQKDLADILRMIEAEKELTSLLPKELIIKLNI